MLNQVFAKRLFLSIENLRGEYINDYLTDLETSQWYSPLALKELQLEKLKMLLNHAYKNVLWYRKKFQERNIVPDDIRTLDDLKILPILTKHDLRSQTAILTAQGYSGRKSIAKTSGSTGISVKFSKDRQSSGYGRAAMYRGHRWFGVDIGDREARLWGVPIGVKERMVHRLADYFLNRFRQTSFELSDIILENYLMCILKNKPKYLMGYPSMVYQFAHFLKERKIDLRSCFAMVKVTSESLYEYQRTLIADIFQCPVVNEYGAAETGLIGFECPYHSMHLMPECVIVEEYGEDELLDGNSELVVTDLNNYALPIIRYKLGDRGKLSTDACKCGRGLPLIDKIQGRSSDIVYKADRTPVHSSVFSYVLKEVIRIGGGVRQYKVYQDEIGQLRMEIVKDSGYKQTSEQIIKEIICRKFGNGMRLDISYVNEIQREKSGKLRYFVSMLDQKQNIQKKVIPC